MCRDINKRIKHLPKIENEGFIDELVGLLTWAHYRFLWIHPFLDYNGRIGRLLINVILLNLRLPPIELRVETISGRDAYIRALKDADSGEYRKLQKLVRKAVLEASLNL